MLVSLCPRLGEQRGRGHAVLSALGLLDCENGWWAEERRQSAGTSGVHELAGNSGLCRGGWDPGGGAW